MELIKIVNYKKPYLGKDGKQHPSQNLYLREVINGNVINVAIDSPYRGRADLVNFLRRDYGILDLLAKVETIGEKSDLK